MAVEATRFVERTADHVTARDPVHDAVTPVWRVVLLVATISLFIGIRTAWTTVLWTHPWAAGIIMIGYAGLLACGILATTVQSARGEYAILGLGIAFRIALLPSQFTVGDTSYANDEGTLTDAAGRALAHGTDPYAVSFPHALDGLNSGITQTMSGQLVTRFGYPPLSLLLNVIAQPFTHRLPVAGMLSTIAIVVAGVVMFVLLPSPWRALGPMVCFGFGLLDPWGRLGYPTIIALPMLMIAVHRWTSIGAGGSLGRAGRRSAVFLGLAAATQQLAWFLAPFLILAILLVRRGDRPAEAGRITVRYAAIAIGTFAAVNVPFAAWHPRAWCTGVLSPLTEDGIPHGQGIIGVTYYVLGGSGALSGYAYATLLYAVGLLACFVLFSDVSGLPSRSRRGRSSTSPSVPRTATSSCWSRYGWRRRLPWTGRPIAAAPAPGGRRRARLRMDSGGWIATTALLMAPALVVLAIAITSPPPLRMTVARPVPGGADHDRVNRLVVAVDNASGEAMSPHFAIADGPDPSMFWIIVTGPRTLAPGATAPYTIDAPSDAAARSSHDRLVLRAFTSRPDTLSSAPVPGPGF